MRPPIQWFWLLFQKENKKVGYIPGILFLLGPKLWVKSCPCINCQSSASNTPVQPTSLFEELPWWIGLLIARAHAYCQVHSQGFFKHHSPFSWHISSCDTSLCPCPSVLWWSSTSCTVPFTGRDEPGRSDEDIGWEFLAVMLCMSYL